MGPRILAASCLALVVLTSSCARPVYKAEAMERSASPAPVPTVIPAPAQAEPPASAPKADLFAASVEPVLKASCSPCHFPGGKMYDRLPFDRPETLASHREGALRRLKGDNRAAFEAWLATLPPAP